MSNPVLHFEIAAKDPEKLVRFYEKIFDWKIMKTDDPVEYWVIETVPVDENMRPLEPGINGGIVRKERPEQISLNYVSVESIDDTVKKIEKMGGKVLMPKQHLKGVGDLAIAQDIEGNAFGLWVMPG